jgi:hypothetical protein
MGMVQKRVRLLVPRLPGGNATNNLSHCTMPVCFHGRLCKSFEIWQKSGKLVRFRGKLALNWRLSGRNWELFGQNWGLFGENWELSGENWGLFGGFLAETVPISDFGLDCLATGQQDRQWQVTGDKATGYKWQVPSDMRRAGKRIQSSNSTSIVYYVCHRFKPGKKSTNCQEARTVIGILFAILVHNT